MKILPLMLILTLIVPALAFSKAAPYQNICEVQKQFYCQFVGKEAYFKSNKNKTILGKIIAVTWKNKGEPVEINPSIKAIKDGLYYVIDTDGTPEGEIVVHVDLIKVVK